MVTKSRVPQGLYGNSDSIDFDEAWDILRSSLLEIHSKNASVLSFEELYRHAYKLVLKKKGELLYQRVKSFEETWLSKTIQPRIISSLSTSLLVPITEGGTTIASANEKRAEGEKLLRSLREAWEDHNLCMNMITDVLMYMVRVKLRVMVLELPLILFRNASTVRTSGNPRYLQPRWANSGIMY